MAMGISSRALRWFDSDRFNPVVVRELRQIVWGNWLTFGLSVYLLLLFMLAVSATGVVDIAWADGRSLGMDVYQRVTTIATFTAAFIVPFYAFDRTSTELAVGDWDLLFHTPMRPMNIISGKVKCAMSLGGILVSICLPFLSLAVMLRGIDVVAILESLCWIFLTMLVCVELAVFSACIQKPKWIRLLGGFVIGGGMLFIVVAMAGLTGGIAGVVIIALTSCVLLHSISAGMISRGAGASISNSVMFPRANEGREDDK